jgi:hypothetical protein
MPAVKRTAATILFAFCFVVASALAAPPYLNILPKPPQDLPSRSASLQDVAKFAWQEFLALNWKASIDAQHPPGASNPRGNPDLTWSPSQAAPAFPNPLVWQTYAQTTELRPNAPLTTAWVNLGFPKYSYANVPAQGSGSFTLWNNLDEDNEIGSCDIYGQYAQQKSPKDLVLFQVKVNRDEYEYVRTAFGATQQIGPPPGKPCPNGALLCAAAAQVTTNILNPPYAYYPGATSTCNCPPGQAICLPCGRLPGNGTTTPVEGTIEVKSAWRRLLPNENPARFYTTKAIYYDINSKGQIAYYNDTFALVGMHIIHKTANFPDFVFATFEQVDVEQSGSNYILLVTNPANPNGPSIEQPPAVPIQRQKGQTNRTQMHPVPTALDQVTAQVQAQLKGMNPTTVWQYYRLTGVYGASTDVPSNPSGPSSATNNCINNQNPIQATTTNPNYYMANFMVESDPFLNNFTGPGFGKNGNVIFTGGCQNTVYANKIYNNGGCKGCHGVAQTAFGTDFSFLLDFGNNKPSIRPATIHYVAPPPATSATSAAAVKLKHYLDLVKVNQP